MAKVNYYLKGCPSKKLLDEIMKMDKPYYNQLTLKVYPVICSISFFGRREIISTNLFISFVAWDARKQEVKDLKESPYNRKKINDFLKDKRKAICDMIEENQLDNNFIERKQLASFFLEEKVEGDLNTIQGVFNRFKLEHKTSDGFSMKHRTEQKYSTLKNHIVNFQKDDMFIPKRITDDWVSRFRAYLIEIGLNDNTVAKYIVGLKTLKKFLNTIGLRIPADMDKIKAVEKEQIVNIIEANELEMLENHKFKNKHYSEVRDVFLFQCYTGQRYSDIQNISRDCITTANGHPVWLVSTKKTDDNIVVPLNSKAVIMLDRYAHLKTPLPRFSNKDVNDTLKEIAREAGLNRKVKQVFFYNNQKKEVTMNIPLIVSQ